MKKSKVNNSLLNEMIVEYKISRVLKKVNKESFLVEDEIGYKFYIRPRTYLMNKNNGKSYELQIFHTNNQYTIENIKLWIDSNNVDFVLKSKNYKGKNKHLWFKCKHGHWFQKTVNGLLDGYGCPYCSKKKIWTPYCQRDLKAISPHIEILEKDIKNNSEPLKCKCRKHNEFLYLTWRQLRDGVGCDKCKEDKIKFKGLNTRKQLEVCRSEIRKIHKTIYVDYEFYRKPKESYKNPVKYVHCICELCGHEWDNLYAYVRACCGCPNCTVVPYGFRRSKWIESGKTSPNFDSYKLYKVKCWDMKKTETFYKIGITFYTVEKRLSREFYGKYNWEIVSIVESEDGGYIWDLEKTEHRIHRNSGLTYLPLKKFGGMYECFSCLI